MCSYRSLLNESINIFWGVPKEKLKLNGFTSRLNFLRRKMHLSSTQAAILLGKDSWLKFLQEFEKDALFPSVWGTMYSAVKTKVPFKPCATSICRLKVPRDPSDITKRRMSQSGLARDRVLDPNDAGLARSWIIMLHKSLIVEGDLVVA